MPSIKREDLDKRSVKLTIEMSLEEMQPFLEAAAERISEETKIPGFRPGKATYDIVKNNVGELKILEAAIEPLVRKSFVEAVMSEKLETAGSPEINVEKMAPGNPLIYTAIVALMPGVEKIGDFTKLSVKKGDSAVKDEDIAKALHELQQMQVSEVRAAVDEIAKKEDKVIVDMSMTKDLVAVEGGDAKGYHVFLNEPNYIPGFAEQLIGLKEGDVKSFKLTFPKDYFQKNLSDAEVEFTVTVKELYHLDHPTIDDAFAEKLGQKDAATLKMLIATNLTAEKDHEVEQMLEREMLDAVVKESRFTDIPEMLVNDEVNKMVHELEHHVEEQGGQFDAYVKSIGKTIAQLKLDLTPQAVQRIKVMLVLRAIARDKEIVVDAKELDLELDKLAAEYEDKEMKDRIYSPTYRDYMENVIRNRKVLEILKAAMVK